MTICIVNTMNDIHCNYMIVKLKERGIPYIELGPLEKNEYTFQNGKLFYNRTYIDFESISSVFLHGNTNFLPKNLFDPYIDTYNQNMVLQAQVENLRIWLKILYDRGVTIINPPVDTSKYYQLFRLIEAKIPVPQTCITNSYYELQNFVSKVGKVIYKPLTGGYYCREVNDSVLEFLRDTPSEPIIFQEYIKGLDIRVYLLNGEVISSHILEHSNDYLDYRQNPAFHTSEYQYELINLPDYVKKFCANAANILGLHFTGIDLKLDEKGNYYLIECNSMPVYMDAEIKLKVPITDKLIDALENTKSQCILLKKQTLHLNATEDTYKDSLFNFRNILTMGHEKKEMKKTDIIVPLNEEQMEDLKKVEELENSKYMIITVDNNELKVTGFI